MTSRLDGSFESSRNVLAFAGAVVLAIACGGNTDEDRSKSSGGASGAAGSAGSSGTGGSAGSGSGKCPDLALPNTPCSPAGLTCHLDGHGECRNCTSVCSADGVFATECEDCQGGSGGASGGSGCDTIVASVSAEVGIVGSCTAIFRLDYQSFAHRGWQLVCGSYAQPTEAAARSEAQQKTGYGETAELLSAPAAQDELVFREPPADFGGAAAVSARNGVAVFGGSIHYLGKGALTHPTSWNPEVGDCGYVASPPSAHGFDLRSGSPLDPQEVSTALTRVWPTAVAQGLRSGGVEIFDAVVLLYPPTLGAFDPAVAEYIVLVNVGWLE